MGSPKLPPLPRPIPWTYDPTFIPVSTQERESFDLAAQVTFNVLCQRCEDLLRKSPELPKIPFFVEDRSSIPVEAQLEIDVSLLRDSAASGCYLCTLLSRETQRSYGATEQMPPFQSIAPHLVCSRLVAPVDAGTSADMDEGHEDDHTYGSTHGVTLTNRHEGGNFYATFFIRHPRTSAPPSAFCSNIYTGSDECLERCRVWLQNCLESHSKCHSNPSPKTPTRLIEIMGPQEVRLVEQATTAQYFALSYCWGGANLLSLTTDTLVAFKDSIPFDQLALTIQDAIGVAYKPGSQYLWVDSLCILQDDAEDWGREAKAMCDVYHNATLTIAALGAARATDGLFARRDPLVFQGCQYYRTWNESLSHRYSAPSVVNQYACFGSGALNSRGWTFQERALSRRTLYFGSSIFWECGISFEVEGKADCRGWGAHFKNLLFPALKESPESLVSRTFPAWPALKKWHKIVLDYTLRDLTRSTDRLPAIAGLIAHFSRHVDWTNILGLWKEHLLVELLWQVPLFIDHRHPRTSGPTWSWISVPGQVTFGGRFEGFLAEAHFDEPDNSAVIIHGVPFELSEFGALSSFPPAPGMHERREDLSVNWDTTERDFGTQPFGVPLQWAFLLGYRAPNSDRVILQGLCLVADGSTGSFRRCGYTSLRTDLETVRKYDIRIQPKQVFRVV